jgi:hypothetical protein
MCIPRAAQANAVEGRIRIASWGRILSIEGVHGSRKLFSPFVPEGRYLKRIHLNPAKKKELKFEAQRFHTILSCGVCTRSACLQRAPEPFAFRRISPSVEDVHAEHGRTCGMPKVRMRMDVCTRRTRACAMQNVFLQSLRGRETRPALQPTRPAPLALRRRRRRRRRLRAGFEPTHPTSSSSAGRGAPAGGDAAGDGASAPSVPTMTCQ